MTNDVILPFFRLAIAAEVEFVAGISAAEIKKKVFRTRFLILSSCENSSSVVRSKEDVKMHAYKKNDNTRLS